MTQRRALPFSAETLCTAARFGKALLLCWGWGVGGSLDQLSDISIHQAEGLMRRKAGQSSWRLTSVRVRVSLAAARSSRHGWPSIPRVSLLPR